MATDLFKGHSAAWIAGYKEGAVGGMRMANERYVVDLWLREQERIDHEAWLVVQGVIIGCLLVILTYAAGRL